MRQPWYEESLRFKWTSCSCNQSSPSKSLCSPTPPLPALNPCCHIRAYIIIQGSRSPRDLVLLRLHLLSHCSACLGISCPGAPRLWHLLTLLLRELSSVTQHRSQVPNLFTSLQHAKLQTAELPYLMLCSCEIYQQRRSASCCSYSSLFGKILHSLSLGPAAIWRYSPQTALRAYRKGKHTRVWGVCGFMWVLKDSEVGKVTCGQERAHGLCGGWWFGSRDSRVSAGCRARTEPVRHTAVREKERESKCARGQFQMLVM